VLPPTLALVLGVLAREVREPAAHLRDCELHLLQLLPLACELLAPTLGRLAQLADERLVDRPCGAAAAARLLLAPLLLALRVGELLCLSLELLLHLLVFVPRLVVLGRVVRLGPSMRFADAAGLARALPLVVRDVKGGRAAAAAALAHGASRACVSPGGGTPADRLVKLD